MNKEGKKYPWGERVLVGLIGFMGLSALFFFGGIAWLLGYIPKKEVEG